MANKLKDMEISSVDLCKKGANQNADIKLFKSASTREGGENVNENNGMVQKIAKFLAGLVSDDAGGKEPITKAASVADVRETTEALRKSLESIIADDSLTPVEKHDMMADSLQQFTLEATDLMDGWAGAVEKAGEEVPEKPEDPKTEEEKGKEKPGDKPEEIGKGVFDMATIDITKMSPEDRATLEALEKKYAAPAAAPAAEVHPDVQKAIDEVAELRKSLEMQEMTGIAKKYEIIGKKADELAPKLYELKKAGEQHYNDYIALLDEQVQMQNSGIFKEIGSSRSGPSDLEGIVTELRKSDPSMTREQAVMKAYETNPGLDPFTGKLRA